MIIGITSGCFDILHPLHILYLKKCSRRCDKLIVLLDSDELIIERKGMAPVFNEEDRYTMITALRSVHSASIIENMNEFRSFVECVKQFHNKAGEYVVVFKHKDEIDGQPLISIPNVENIIIGDVNRFSSSTQIRKFLIQQFDKELKL